MNYASKQALLTVLLFIAIMISAFSGLVLITGFFVFAANLFAHYGAILWIALLVLGIIAGYGIVVQLKE